MNPISERPIEESVRGLVSTIIAVFNRPHTLRKAVESVLDQTYRPIELILVDDGSTDGRTPDMLDSMAAGSPEIIRVFHQANAGPGPARETGRQAARGEFIQYLDSDDWLLPGKFETQVSALRAKKDCDIAYGITRLVNDEGETLKEPSKHTGERHESLFPLLLEDRWWHTSTPLYRCSISDAAGQWEARRPEDWDLEARMGAMRPRLAFCNEVVSCHREHNRPGRVSHGDQLKYLQDEAWFFPRLYQCARQAGIAPGSIEMKRFSRWVFMRARYLGFYGKDELADQLIRLAWEASADDSFDIRIARILASTLGWKVTGRFARWWDSLRRFA